MTSNVTDDVTVEFGPLEERGVLLGVSAPSMAAIGGGVLAGLAALFVVGGTAGLLLAVALIAGGLALGFVPLHGTRLADWAVVVVGFLVRRTTGRHVWRSTAPQAGWIPIRPAPLPLPAALAASRTRVANVTVGDRRVGIIIDGGCAIGVLRARAAGAFLMRQPDEQAASTAHWAEVIGSIADPGSPWVRLQWIDTTTPGDGAGLMRYLIDAGGRDVDAPDLIETGRRIYERLIRTAAPVSESHDIFIAAALDPARVARQVKDAGGGDAGLATVCARHLEALAFKLAGGDLIVDRPLTEYEIGTRLREHIDPGERRWQSQVIADGDSEMAGVDPATAWTLAADETFTTYRTDGAWHATLWVKEWPRRPSRVDFLAPLLLRTGSITRTLSVTMAPVDAATALRQAEDAATSDESDEELRGRFGVRTSGRRRREAHAATRREEELLDGYDDVRFSAYVTVSAPDPAMLEEAVAEVMTQARAARLRLVRLVGQQPEAFWYTAPLCRGVR